MDDQSNTLTTDQHEDKQMSDGFNADPQLPAGCPRCGARSIFEAAARCTPVDDSCPATDDESLLVDTLPSRFQIGEEVSVHGRECLVAGISFNADQMVYAVLDREGHGFMATPEHVKSKADAPRLVLLS